MGSRLPYVFGLMVLAIAALFIVAARPLTCTDPLGCALLQPNEDISIGVEVLTSGSGRPASLEIQQGAALAAKSATAIAGHALAVLPFYSTCLPGGVSQSAIDLSASNTVLVILGPACVEGAGDLLLRAARAGKAVISPLPIHPSSPAGALVYSPDQADLVRQTAQRLASLGYTKLVGIASVDQANQDFYAALCSALAAQEIVCSDNAAGTGPVDAALAISLDENTALSADTLSEWPDLPHIYVSLTLPQVHSADAPPSYWIGPLAWDGIRKFVSVYQAAYQTPPVSLAAWVSYDSISLLEQAFQKTGGMQWDGSWIFPRSILRDQILSEGKGSGIFKFNCGSSTPGCQEFPLALYQFSENDYRLVKP